MDWKKKGWHQHEPIQYSTVDYLDYEHILKINIFVINLYLTSQLLRSWLSFSPCRPSQKQRKLPGVFKHSSAHTPVTHSSTSEEQWSRRIKGQTEMEETGGQEDRGTRSDSCPHKQRHACCLKKLYVRRCAPSEIVPSLDREPAPYFGNHCCKASACGAPVQIWCWEDLSWTETFLSNGGMQTERETSGVWPNWTGLDHRAVDDLTWTWGPLLIWLSEQSHRGYVKSGFHSNPGHKCY